MDYESVREFFNSENTPYILSIVSTVLGATAGYFAGRNSRLSRDIRETRSHLEIIAELKVKEKEADVALANSGNEVELRRIDNEQKEKEYQQSKELEDLRYVREKA